MMTSFSILLVLTIGFIVESDRIVRFIAWSYGYSDYLEG
jgi:hypothetical protein